MSIAISKVLVSSFVVGSGLLLNACTVMTPAPVYYRGNTQYPPPANYPAGSEVNVQAVQTETAPPPPMQEVITVAPAPGYLWVNGFWYWEGGRHVWRAGYWAPPRVGFTWFPHRWERVGVHWHFRPGHWRHR
ncbi:YXWGXW repeat-containing protein [Undibacterium cyanobacteriorum]|uniref:YXWGXW repeat-containing protein n=1 Tax=Undibacterium cyanobacteriorum TaxID=3073561 RepID=A0ABY9RGX6_9BURK|nr:YXWGXW repeat-containing protein [Undibacterium sp. 20NA77.5]WMW79346.1 YXWGXW repeat-containing protein [Undibacterium sp. 20NA77.5]